MRELSQTSCLRSPLHPPSLGADPHLLDVARRGGRSAARGRRRARARHGLRQPAPLDARAPHHGRARKTSRPRLPRGHRALRGPRRPASCSSPPTASTCASSSRSAGAAASPPTTSSAGSARTPTARRSSTAASSTTPTSASPRTSATSWRARSASRSRCSPRSRRWSPSGAPLGALGRLDVPARRHALHIPGLLLWVALALRRCSRPGSRTSSAARSSRINFDRLRFEADFRYGLVRFRDNVEAGGALARRGRRAARRAGALPARDPELVAADRARSGT